MWRAVRLGIDVRREETEARLADGRLVNLLVNTSPPSRRDGRREGRRGRSWTRRCEGRGTGGAAAAAARAGGILDHR